jgi:hypothetical protein
VASRIPASPPRPGTHVAIVLQSGSALQRQVERRLVAQRVPHRRSEWENLVIFSEMDSSHIHAGAALPQELAMADWKKLPADLDGFN